MASIFLTDLDDFLDASQACVNPLFKDTPTNAPSSTSNNLLGRTSHHLDDSARRGLVVTRRKQSNRKRIVLSSNESGWKDSNNLIDGSKGEKATVSVADCLACSGCITAAESVMVGKHSLPTLRENCLGQYGTYHISSHNQELHKRDRKIIFTISPAVVADLTRFIYLDREESILSDRSTIDNNTREMAASVFFKLSAFLHQQLGAHFIIDGQVVGDISLLESAYEFIHRYRTSAASASAASGDDKSIIVDLPLLNKPGSTYGEGIPHSIAISATETRYVTTIPNDAVTSPASSTTETVHHKPGRVPTRPNHDSNMLPMLASSCPGFVCFVEKTAPHCIPSLSSAKSAMSISGFIVKHILFPPTSSNKNIMGVLNDDQSVSSTSCYHVAIMPCHDKKLEASRKDMAWEQLMTTSPIPDVDLVITTSELIDLMKEVGCASKISITQQVVESSETFQKPPFDIVSYFDSLPTASVVQHDSRNTTNGSEDWTSAANGIHSLLTTLKTTESVKEEDATFSVLANKNSKVTTALSWNAPTQSSLSGSSGSYADFIFRFAALQLFGYLIPAEVSLPWRNVRRSSNFIPPTEESVSTSNQPSSRGRRITPTNTNLDFREVILYKSRRDEQYSLNMVNGEVDADESRIPVLKFATAYGFKNIQSIILKMKRNSTKERTSTSIAKVKDSFSDYHYIEVMACPSGCLNGGGQAGKLNRYGDQGFLKKESPTEKRDRLRKNHMILDSRISRSHKENPLVCSIFPALRSTVDDHLSNDILSNTNEKSTEEIPYDELPALPFVSGPFKKESHQVFHTRYHSVPKLQLSVGAVSGVAISDTKW